MSAATSLVPISDLRFLQFLFAIITPMVRTLQSWLAALLLSGTLCFPVQAQIPDNAADKEPRHAVPETVVAFLVTVLILAVVCTPSRKP